MKTKTPRSKLRRGAPVQAERNLAITRTYFGRDWDIDEEVIYFRNEKASASEYVEYDAVIKSWPKKIPEAETLAKVNIEYDPGDGTPKKPSCVMVRSLRGKVDRPSKHPSTVWLG